MQLILLLVWLYGSSGAKFLIVNKLATYAILTIKFLVEPPAKFSLVLLGQIGLNLQLIFSMSKGTLMK